MGINIHNEAPLSSRILMILRELPAYLSTAYSLRFKEQPQGSLLHRIFEAIARPFILLKELINYRPSRASFQKNIAKMDEEFEKINESVKDGKKPICAYFVNSEDSNGAILGDPVYYYHHYKIRKFQKHFDVSAKVIRSVHDMFEHIKNLKRQYPDRPIKVVDVVSHGAPTLMDINVRNVALQQMRQAVLQKKIDEIQRQDIDAAEKHKQIMQVLYQPEAKEADEEGEIRHYKKGCTCYCNDQIQDEEFADCAKDAVIIIDACSTGEGENSVAESIARRNPGKTVFAPGCPLFFSKPIFEAEKEAVKVANVVHGFAVFNAYTAKKFQRALV